MHWDNPGHLVFENLLPIFVSLEQWQLDPRRAVLFNGCRRSCPLSGSLAETFARAVFSDYTGLQPFHGMAAGRPQCFSSLLVGTGGEATAGLHGGAAFHTPSLLRMRSALLRASGLNGTRLGVPPSLRVLLLNKTKGHGGRFDNLHALPAAIRAAYPNVSVEVIEPWTGQRHHWCRCSGRPCGNGCISNCSIQKHRFGRSPITFGRGLACRDSLSSKPVR